MTAVDARLAEMDLVFPHGGEELMLAADLCGWLRRWYPQLPEHNIVSPPHYCLPKSNALHHAYLAAAYRFQQVGFTNN